MIKGDVQRSRLRHALDELHAEPRGEHGWTDQQVHGVATLSTESAFGNERQTYEYNE